MLYAGSVAIGKEEFPNFRPSSIFASKMASRVVEVVRRNHVTHYPKNARSGCVEGEDVRRVPEEEASQRRGAGAAGAN